MDTYSIIAIGCALGIGAIPLIKQIIKPDPNFLVGYGIKKSLMSKTEREEYEKIGYTAFMKKIEEESKWRKKHNIPYESNKTGR